MVDIAGRSISPGEWTAANTYVHAWAKSQDGAYACYTAIERELSRVEPSDLPNKQYYIRSTDGVLKIDGLLLLLLYLGVPYVLSDSHQCQADTSSMFLPVSQ